MSWANIDVTADHHWRIAQAFREINEQTGLRVRHVDHWPTVVERAGWLTLAVEVVPGVRGPIIQSILSVGAASGPSIHEAPGDLDDVPSALGHGANDTDLEQWRAVARMCHHWLGTLRTVQRIVRAHGLDADQEPGVTPEQRQEHTPW